MVELRPYELKKVIWDSGYKIKEFTDSIGRSKSFFENSIGPNHFVPPRYIEAAIKLVGKDAFEYALSKNRDYHRRIEREQQLRELKEKAKAE